MRKTIVLAADNKYLIPLETTIKSIMCHNTEVDLYVLNSDIAPEWFKLLRPRLAQLDSTIHNVRLDDSLFSDYKTIGHINYATYFRLLIPEVVPSERVLYLDSDLIVNGDLCDLYATNLEGYSFGAVWDPNGTEEPGFNAGVLLIDNKKWREDDVVPKLLSLAAEYNQTLKFADQSVLKMFFGDSYFHLPSSANYFVGIDFWKMNSELDYLEENPPLVAHFLTEHKPWNTFTNTRLRTLWWAYNALDWSSICNRSIQLDYKSLSKESKKSLFVYTYSLELENIDYLIRHLSDYHFHIAAPTFCASSLLNLSSYPNVTIYQNILKSQVKWILDDVSLYLDINHYQEVDNIIQRVKEYQVPIVAFDNTCHDSSGGAYVYSHEHPEEMVAAIRQLMEEKKHAQNHRSCSR